MKKYFSVLSMFIIPFVGHAADITTVMEVGSDDETGVAVEAYDSYLPCCIKAVGSDVTFTIYNTSDFSVKEEFTLRNIGGGLGNYKTSDWNVRGLYESDWFTTCDKNGACIYLTKNVFNDDDNWEVLLRSEYGNGYKYKVINDKGEIVTTFYYSDFGLPASSFGNDGLEYLFFLENSYLSVKSDERKIISFKGNGAGVKHVAAFSGLNVYPNPLRRGESLTVRLPREADENTMLFITDMEGRTVCRHKIDAGATTVTVEAGTLFTGTYIYTLISPDRQPLSGKLIVE